MKEQNQLEQEFKKIYNETLPKIQQYIENAREELNKAVSLANETGIPFHSNIVEFIERGFVPKSFDKKWNIDFEDMQEILDDENLYFGNEFNKNGWESWNGSSLTC